MKEPRFIELINLYVDRQISPAETAELEAEIQANPRHRKIYQQYCHMHRATKMVYETFRANAEQPAVEPSRSGGSVASFEYSRKKTSRTRWLYSTAGLAAAACFAIVLVRTGSFAKVENEAVVASAQPKAAAIAPAAVMAQPVAPVVEPEAQAALAAQQYAALLSLKRQEDMRAFALAQKQIAQPITLFADSVFDEKHLMAAESQKLLKLKGKTDSKTPIEFTAFQFQR